MLLGYTMDSRGREWQPVLPHGEPSDLIAEPVDDLASPLMQFSLWWRGFAQQRPPAEWLLVCHDLLNDLSLPDSGTETILTSIKQQWLVVIGSGLETQYGDQVSLALLRDELVQRLGQQRVSQRFLVGPISICTPTPICSIPFKVVCLLGTNDGVYPQTLPPLSFGLMNQKPQRGDRNRCGDGRYPFLGALMSVKQAPCVSYIGRSTQDNDERFPSVLV